MTDQLLYLTIGVFLFFGTVTAVTVLYPPKNVIASMAVISLVVLSPLFLYSPILASLGYPVKIEEQLDAEYLSYSVSGDSKWIYLWTLDIEDGEPRAYRIPYSKADEESLQKADKEKGRGLPQRVEKGEQSPIGNDNAAGVLDFEPLPDGGGGK